MNCSKESKSSLFSLSHSAVSLRTNLFSLKIFFFTSPGRFCFRPSRLRRAVLSPFQLPYLFSFLSSKSCLTPPCPPSAGPWLSPDSFPFPPLLQGQARQTLGPAQPAPPPGRPPGTTGNPFSWPPRLQRTKSESVMASRGKDLKPERPLSTRDGKGGRGTSQPPP